MNRSIKNIACKASIVFALFLSIAACSGKRTADFSLAINQIDRLLEAGSIQQASGEINLLWKVSRSRDEWTKALKRAYAVGRASGDYELLRDGAQRAHKSIPGVEDFSALLVYGLLRTGRYEQAIEVSRETLKNEKWFSLINEAYFWEGQIENREANAGRGGLLLALLESDDPLAFARAAQIFDDDRLSLDAALLSMYHGKVDDAYNFIFPIHDNFEEPFMFIAYDSGKYEEALAALDLLRKSGQSGNSELLLFGTDLFYLANDLSSAYEFGFHLIKTDPMYSWIPFINVSSLLLKTNDFETATRLIETGSDLYPMNRNLELARIKTAIATGKIESAEEMIEIFRRDFGDDVNVVLLAYQLSRGRESIQRFESRLWELYLKEPDNYKNARYLASFLLSIRDMKGLDYLIDVFVEHNGNMEWTFFCKGITASVLSDNMAGLSNFNSALDLKQRWETLYNIAVLQIDRRDYDQALDNLRKAEFMLDWSEASGSNRAVIRIRIAGTLYKMGDLEAAVREARYALDLDPGLPEGRLLLKMLEESFQ
jgi:tetratricopeptide (TPR) repeat protein